MHEINNIHNIALNIKHFTSNESQKQQQRQQPMKSFSFSDRLLNMR